MLIKALCDYYDILSKNGKVLPYGYSIVEVSYIIALTEDGKIDEIIKCENQYKSKVKMIFPYRYEKSTVNSEIIEHRFKYIFGLEQKNKMFAVVDEKYHRAFVEANLKFTEGVNSPIIKAYRNFILSWKPEEETENKQLIELGKDLSKAAFAFCMSGSPDCLLHEDVKLKEKWNLEFIKRSKEDSIMAQCAITGNEALIPKTHRKIKHINGGKDSGVGLVTFKNDAECSYGNNQSYNSNISFDVMLKYTEMLNYLSHSSKHKVEIDDMTILFWAMSVEEKNEDLFIKLLLGNSDKMDTKKTNDMLKELMDNAKEGRITRTNIESLDKIEENVQFYIVGLKPNYSRFAIKFVLCRKFENILQNIAKFQEEIQVTQQFHGVYLWQIVRELESIKTENDKVDPALMSKFFESIIYGKKYPVFLLERMVRRVKIDSDEKTKSSEDGRKTDKQKKNQRSKVNYLRAGVIKACINRNYPKEELKMALDKDNMDQAYLCGRLFAVIEELQRDAADQPLNRTIKDSYFASAVSRPVLVFPRIVCFAQNYLKKAKDPNYYSKLIYDIVNNIDEQFPETLLLKEQGKFIVGYYQQYKTIEAYKRIKRLKED